MDDLITKSVVLAIAAQYRDAAERAAADFEDQREDEDSLTGALGSKLKEHVRGEAVGDDHRAYRWETRLVKVRGRGKGAAEKRLGADAFLEIVVEDAEGNVLRRKTLPLQAKKEWSGSDPRLSAQVEKMLGAAGDCLVVDYRAGGYVACRGDAVATAGGNRRQVPPGEIISLGEALGERFTRCKLGTTKVRYDPARRELVPNEPSSTAPTGPTMGTLFVQTRVRRAALSEAVTRDHIIDPRLDKTGWPGGSGTGRRTEEEPTGNGPADYALWLDDHPPVPG